jgi:hypothetical protein
MAVFMASYNFFCFDAPGALAQSRGGKNGDEGVFGMTTLPKWTDEEKPKWLFR